jgi:hypothetical protein
MSRPFTPRLFALVFTALSLAACADDDPRPPPQDSVDTRGDGGLPTVGGGTVTGDAGPGADVILMDGPSNGGDASGLGDVSPVSDANGVESGADDAGGVRDASGASDGGSDAPFVGEDGGPRDAGAPDDAFAPPDL